MHGATVRTKAELEAAFDDACAIATRVMHCVSDIASQGMAPGMLVFGHDVNINISVLTDIVAVSAYQQSQTDPHPLCKNQQRTHHECKVGHQVCVINHFSSVDKLKQAWVRPFPILCVHANGAVTIHQGQTHEQISICCVKPAMA